MQVQILKYPSNLETWLDPGGGGGGALRFFFDGGVPQPTTEWGSKERTTRVKYRVLGTTELLGRVENGV